MRNPYKLILSNAKGAQNGWNKKHQKWALTAEKRIYYYLGRKS